MAVEKIRVSLLAGDPLSYAGLVGYLEARSELALLTGAQHGECDVVVAALDRPGRPELLALREPTADYSKPVVFITNEIKIDEAELITAVRCRVVSILSRAAVTGDQLLHSVVTVAAGGGVMPPNLVGDLMTHIKRLQEETLTPSGPTRAGLMPREVDVLRLLAHGMDTVEIAGRLCYSERTVKNVIHGVTGRLKLRNRSHAVAYAFRTGVI